MIKKVLLTLLLLLNIKGYSQEWEINLTLGSFHYERTYLDLFEPTKYNEFNPGAIIQKRRGNLKIGGGYVLNSYNKSSLIALVGTDITPHLDFNIGVATGYSNTEIDMDLLPLAVISYKIKNFKVGLSPQFLLYSLNFRL